MDREPHQTRVVELLPEMDMEMSPLSESTTRYLARGLGSEEVLGNPVVELESTEEGISARRFPRGEVSIGGVSSTATVASPPVDTSVGTAEGD